MLLDLDHFKRVNDIHGHLVGDAVVQRVGRALRVTLRETDYPVRYGGEELLVVMPGTEVREAQAVANRVREAVANLELSDLAEDLGVTVSIGIALRQTGEEISPWIERTDKALYEAKSQGRDRVGIAPTPPVSPIEENSVDTDRVTPPEEFLRDTLVPTRLGPSDGRSGGEDEGFGLEQSTAAGISLSEHLHAQGFEAWPIGKIVAGDGNVELGGQIGW